jgi:hypothetical protein
MYAAFQGFDTIESFMEAVEVTEDLIGFTEEGRPKVWLNEQLHLNYNKSKSSSFEGQSHRVRTIFSFLEPKIMGRQISNEVRWELLTNILNYSDAIILL